MYGEVEDPDHHQGSNQIASKQADTSESQQIVHDHHHGEDHRDDLEVTPAKKAIPGLSKESGREADPAKRSNENKNADEPGTKAPKYRPSQQSMGLAGGGS